MTKANNGEKLYNEVLSLINERAKTTPINGIDIVGMCVNLIANFLLQDEANLELKHVQALAKQISDEIVSVYKVSSLEKSIN